MAQKVPIITDGMPNEELIQLNQMLANRIYGKGKYADFTQSETAAFALLSHWTGMMYATDQKSGNLVTIRDSRPSKLGTRATKWRVSIYYAVDEEERQWWTAKHQSLATAITNAVVQSFINNHQIAELERSL